MPLHLLRPVHPLACPGSRCTVPPCSGTSWWHCSGGWCPTQHFISLHTTLVSYPLWMLYSCYQLFHRWHLVSCGSIQGSPLVVLPNVALPFAYHIWFLTLCECFNLPIDCSSIGTVCYGSIHVSLYIVLPNLTVGFFACRLRLVYCGSIQGSPWVLCYPTCLFPSHISFGSLPFVYALLLLWIVLPSSCVLWFTSCVTVGMVLPDMTLHLACHIWFLTLSGCSITIDCSTIGILYLSIVVHFSVTMGILLPDVTSIFACHIRFFYPLWLLYSCFQLFHHRHLVICGSNWVSPWVSCYPTWLRFCMPHLVSYPFVDALFDILSIVVYFKFHHGHCSASCLLWFNSWVSVGCYPTWHSSLMG